MVRVEGMTAQAWEMDGRNGDGVPGDGDPSAEVGRREKAAA